MEIRLGEKIKNLRKARNISQEVLAQTLGVSFQAVSKWETGATLPDVAMIPAIAGFFGVSTDELFDFNLMEQEQKIYDITWKAAQIRREKPAEAEAILRDGLKQFPGNDIILNNLLYTMRSPERSEEVITLCKALIETTKYDDVKYDALRILAETYHERGEQSLVKPTLEQIPEIYFSKLELDAQLLEGEESLKAAKGHFGIAAEDTVLMLQVMVKRLKELDQPEKAEKYRTLALRLLALYLEFEDVIAEPRRFAWFREVQKELESI